VLVEVRSKEELERALTVTEDLIGINNRDLDTFKIDSERTRELATEIPPRATIVAESGIRTVEDLERLAANGAIAALIGTALMNSSDPAEACRRYAAVATPKSQADHVTPEERPAYA
jgi:indole-3-glycerol phosphate synthase